MIATMAEKRRKSGSQESRRGQRAPGTQDVFARLKEEEVAELDKAVAEIVPETSRSAVIAMLIRRYLAERKKQ